MKNIIRIEYDEIIEIVKVHCLAQGKVLENVCLGNEESYDDDTTYFEAEVVQQSKEAPQCQTKSDQPPIMLFNQTLSANSDPASSIRSEDSGIALQQDSTK